jgi:hypothetical protein
MGVEPYTVRGVAVVEPAVVVESAAETLRGLLLRFEKRKVVSAHWASAGNTTETSVEFVASDPGRVRTAGVEELVPQAFLPFSYIFPTFHATFSNLFRVVSFPFLTAWASQSVSDWDA